MVTDSASNMVAAFAIAENEDQSSSSLGGTDRVPQLFEIDGLHADAFLEQLLSETEVPSFDDDYDSGPAAAPPFHRKACLAHMWQLVIKDGVKVSVVFSIVENNNSDSFLFQKSVSACKISF